MNNFMNAGHDYARAAANLQAWRAEQDRKLATSVSDLKASMFDGGGVIVNRGDAMFFVSKDKAGYKVTPNGNRNDKLGRFTDIKQLKTFLNKF